MWKQLWERRPGAVAGTAIGIFLGVIYLFFGFWDMLIFAFIAFLGYYFGAKTDRKEPLFPFEDTKDWLSDRWKMFR
ncbi:DUF2273 domain-containing protein [Paenibacillus thalictri]|uniref:DUF2273 domain-containing protein n=1 Tax=Paenibacillus thalictri TaxID=2527873 RepID=A0A4Q9DSL1_9BACL|nr:DUF2273 domain-containing protein [Paenibacillus thalictri]TBL79874.1 DUF2273 domain-containing protein [Paenibacillus thalictri]